MTTLNTTQSPPSAINRSMYAKAPEGGPFQTAYFLVPPAPIEPSDDDLVGPEAVAAFMGRPLAKAERAMRLGAIPVRTVGGVLTCRRSRLQQIFAEVRS